MSDYTEHLISMAGGDGEPLDAIKQPYAAERERRAAVAYAIRDTLPTRNAWDMADAAIEAAGIPALLAVVREQRAVIERVEAVVTTFYAKPGHRWAASHLRAALTTTDPS